jgi:hypothetical protein
LFEQFDAMLRQAGYIAMSGRVAVCGTSALCLAFGWVW